MTVSTPCQNLRSPARRLLRRDILMPRLDGYQTCALHQKNAHSRARPHHLSSKDGLIRTAPRAGWSARRIPDQALTKDSPRKQLRSRARPYLRSSPVPVKKILIVDDSPTARSSSWKPSRRTVSRASPPPRARRSYQKSKSKADPDPHGLRHAVHQRLPMLRAPSLATSPTPYP